MTAVYDVFISYSRADSARVKIIYAKLQALGLSVFFDAEGIDTGAEFPEVIDQAVKNAKVVLGCWTHEAVERRWVRIESRIGLDRGTLIPLAIKPMKPEDLPAEFYNVNILDLSSFKGEDDHPGWIRAVQAIERRLDRAGLADNAAQKSKKTKGFLGSSKGKLIAAALAVAVLGGGWIGAQQAGLIGSGAPDAAALSADFDQAITSTQPIIKSAASGAIDEIQKAPTGRLIWGAAQLVALSNGGLSADDLASYQQVIEQQTANDCSCLTIDGAPHTVGSTWIIQSYVRSDKPAPEPVLAGLLGAQMRDGWWSSALDAADQPDSASIYVTALAILALDAAETKLAAGDPQKDIIIDARQRALTWLRSKRPPSGRTWSDYPDNEQRTENATFSAMATIALLHHSTGDEARSIADDFITVMDDIPEPNDNFSNNIFVTRTNSERFVDIYRHVPLGWKTHALGVSYRHASSDQQEKAALFMQDAARRNMNVPGLAKQQWMIAEAMFGFDYARNALKKSP